ncbi:hypothetical protein ACTFIZ_002719 [Dictyostelium cf. discoideum]
MRKTVRKNKQVKRELALLEKEKEEIESFTKVSKTVENKQSINSNWNVTKEKIKNKNNAYQKKKEAKLKLKSPTPYTSTKVIEDKKPFIKDFNQLCQEHNIISPNDDNLVSPTQKEIDNLNESSKFFSIDCKIIEIEGSKGTLGKICIANQNGQIVYEKIVKPMDKVVDFRTKFTGLTRDKVQREGTDFLQVQKEVEKILRHKILVGHDLVHDLKNLKLAHKKKLLRDATQFTKFFNPDTKSEDSLKSIAKRELNFSPDNWDPSGKRDTIINVILYKKNQKEWETFINNKFYGQPNTANDKN